MIFPCWRNRFRVACRYVAAQQRRASFKPYGPTIWQLTDIYNAFRSDLGTRRQTRNQLVSRQKSRIWNSSPSNVKLARWISSCSFAEAALLNGSSSAGLGGLPAARLSSLATTLARPSGSASPALCITANTPSGFASNSATGAFVEGRLGIEAILEGFRGRIVEGRLLPPAADFK